VGVLDAKAVVRIKQLVESVMVLAAKWHKIEQFLFSQPFVCAVVQDDIG
jgi:hypothetical protein